MIIGILLALGIGMLLLRWFLKADPAAVASGLKRASLIIIVIAITFLLFTGRLNFIFPLMLLLIPLLMPTLLKYLNVQSPGQNPFRKSSSMTLQEAYEILGLKPGASNREILEAHKRLMKKIHPDTGGSNYLAQKLNEAKDILIGKPK
jgi:hypothetical protein